MPMGKAIMQAEEFRLIREFVDQVFGLLLEEGTERYLSLKLAPRLEALRLSSFADYYGYLKFAPRSAEERQQFVSLITNNETYFFREEAQLEAFSREVLPAVKEAKLARGERTLRILSAGCSSGEEVYTLAMLVHESGLFAWDWEVSITGVDVDPRVLERARAGRYSQRSFRAAKPQFVERYFKECGAEFEVRELLRKTTRFLEGNLLDLDGVLAAGQADIVFCRNVLIYFSAETMQRVVDNLGRLHAPQGVLFLGHSESLSRMAAPYLPVRYPGTIVYRKKD
jgi:chemotaxis protein methyltransferase CheR